MPVQQLLGLPQIAGRRGVHALALDRLDDQRRDIAPLQLAAQRVQIAERHGRVGEQRGEPVAEAALPVDRQGSGGEPVEGVVAVEDPGLPGGVPGELQRRLDRFRTAVPEENAVQVRAVGQQLLGEQSGQRLAVEAGEVGQLGVQDVVQGLPDDGVVAAQAHDAEAGEHVEVVVALRVPEVRALGPLVDLVEADGVEHARQLVVEVARVQLVPLGPALGEEPRQIEALGSAVRHRPLFSFGCAASCGRPPRETRGGRPYLVGHRLTGCW
ncbi:hypothetical protein SFIMM107S_07527 [Streptomyces griseus]